MVVDVGSDELSNSEDSSVVLDSYVKKFELFHLKAKTLLSHRRPIRVREQLRGRLHDLPGDVVLAVQRGVGVKKI